MTPKFYSKISIGIFTILLTPLFGFILFSYNLREIGKLQESRISLILAFVWPILFRLLLLPILGDGIIQLLVSGLVGSLFLTFYCWDKYLGNYAEYETRKIWKPVLIVTLIFLALFLFGMAANHKF